MPEAAVEEALASSSLPRMYIASACTREAGVTRAGLCGSIRRMRARAPSRDKGMMAMIKIDSSTSHSQHSLRTVNSLMRTARPWAWNHPA